MPKLVTPVAGRDYSLLPNGSLVVARNFPNLGVPYSPEPIPHYLSAIDHKLRLGKKEYNKRLYEEEAEFKHLVYDKLQKSHRAVVVELMGRDTAGKTGARVKLEEALGFNAKIFGAVPIGAPTPEELAHGNLWRFFTGDRMPRFGEVRVFDRGWSEQLMVVRVEGIQTRKENNKEYAVQRNFEWILQQQGAILVKFWMDISKKEQWARLEDRKHDKPEKLSKADYEARKKWPKYTVCANEMFHRTGTVESPWHLISSENKRYSRVTVLEVINHRLRAELAA